MGQVPEYAEVEELANIFNNTIDVEKYITKSLKISEKIITREVCMKDSRGITDIDRQTIQSFIEQGFGNGCRFFLITHGTYTMPDTGTFLKKNYQKKF